MGEDICCSESIKNNQSVHVILFTIKINYIILQFSFNSGNRKKNKINATFEFHSKRKNSYDTALIKKDVS